MDAGVKRGGNRKAYLFLEPLSPRLLPFRELLLLRGSSTGQQDFEFLGPDHALEMALSEFVLPKDVLEPLAHAAPLPSSECRHTPQMNSSTYTPSNISSMVRAALMHARISHLSDSAGTQRGSLLCRVIRPELLQLLSARLVLVLNAPQEANKNKIELVE